MSPLLLSGTHTGFPAPVVATLGAIHCKCPAESTSPGFSGRKPEICCRFGALPGARKPARVECSAWFLYLGVVIFSSNSSIWHLGKESAQTANSPRRTRSPLCVTRRRRHTHGTPPHTCQTSCCPDADPTDAAGTGGHRKSLSLPAGTQTVRPPWGTAWWLSRPLTTRPGGPTTGWSLVGAGAHGHTDPPRAVTAALHVTVLLGSSPVPARG